MKYLSSQNRGYTLLFAALTAALVIGVAAFIVSVSRKQFILSTVARDSLYALYAADSGIECAAPASITSLSGGSFQCSGATINVPAFTSTGNINIVGGTTISSVKTATVNVQMDGGRCAVITFITGIISPTAYPITLIQSRGYNTCVQSGGVWVPNTTGSRTVERALQLTRYGTAI